MSCDRKCLYCVNFICKLMLNGYDGVCDKDGRWSCLKTTAMILFPEETRYTGKENGMRLIDADALIEAINTWPKYGVDERGRIVPWSDGLEPYIHLRDAVMTITGMPTIEECKTGKWVHLGGDEWCCDKCGHVITTEGSWEHPHDIGAKYCENCGADTRGKQDE